MTFIEFLKHQIQPCVYCYPTPDIDKKVPDYEAIIVDAWENAQTDLPIKIRYVFPPSNEKLSVLQYNLVSVCESHFDEIYNEQSELKSMEIIREYFFRQEYCNRYFFPDIPIGILIISNQNSKSIDLTKIYNNFPTWVNPFISKLVKAKLNLPSKNIKEPIAKYLANQIIPSYQKLTEKIEKYYDEQWRGFQQRVAAFFMAQDDPFNSILYLKLYGDLCLQRGKYSESYSAYQTIITNSVYLEFTNQAQFCIVLCDILSKNVSERTLGLILTIKKGKLTYNQFFLTMLIELFVRMLLNYKPLRAFNRLQTARLQREKEANILFRPFLKQQEAAISGKHHFPLFLSNSAKLFCGIGAIKLSALCFRASIECFNGVNWPYVTQPLTEETLKVMVETEMNPLDLIVNVLNSKSLPLSEQIANVIKRTQNNSGFQKLNNIDSNNGENFGLYPEDPIYVLPFPCGFITARITEFFAPGFPCVQIRELADEWNQTLERMFGAYRTMTFFDYNSLSATQCCINEEAQIEVSLKFFGEIEISSVYLLVSGSSSKSMSQEAVFCTQNDNRIHKSSRSNSSASFKPLKNSKPIDLKSLYSSSHSLSHFSGDALKSRSLKKIQKVKVKFVPKVVGELEIYGIGFVWKDVCRLESPFKHLPWKISVLEPSARVDFKFSEVCSKVVVGQYIKIEVLAKNSSIPLDSFSLLIKGDVETSLIYPEVEEVLGQSKMEPLIPNEERKITIGARFSKEGKYKLILIFPYWSRKNPPPRYGVKIFEFKVYKPPQLKIEYSESGVQVLAPDYAYALGFSGSIPSIDQHLVVVDGRLCLLDFVSLDANEDEGHEFVLPKFCEKFVLKDENDEKDRNSRKRSKITVQNKLFFWYQNYYGIVQTKIDYPRTPISITIKRNDHLFTFFVSNISGRKLFNLILSFETSGDELNCPIAISGLNRKIISSLDVDQTVVFKTHVFILENNTLLPIILYTETDKYSFNVYLTKE